MGLKFENLLWQHPVAVVTKGELAVLMDGTPNSRYSRLKRAVKKGQLIRIKRGLYCLGKQQNTYPPHPFEIAQKIYGPSCISLESALSYHGLIPEAVYTVTSTTIKRNKTVSTPLGEYVYHHLPIDNFFIGVDLVRENHYQYMIASAWKALLDYVYSYEKKRVNFYPLAESLRLELNDLPKINRSQLSSLQNFYQCNRIKHFVENIPKELICEH